MKKISIITISIVLFSIAVYFSVWYEAYQRSHLFFEQASQNFEEGNFSLALKGGQEYDPDSGGYLFTGGYENVLRVWMNEWARPRPKIYEEAREKIEEIIYQHLTAEEGLAIFQMHLNRNNLHLPEILIHTGHQYWQRGDLELALEVFHLALDAFGGNQTIRQEAEESIAQIQEQLGTEAES